MRRVAEKKSRRRVPLWPIEVDRRAKEARRLEQERLCAAALEEQAVNWNKSQLLTSYLSAMRAAAQHQLGASEPSKAVDDWLVWAEAYAASLNPLPAQLKQLTRIDERETDD